MEIGTWSNEMAEFGDSSDSNFKFPDNLSMVRNTCFKTLLLLQSENLQK